MKKHPSVSIVETRLMDDTEIEPSRVYDVIVRDDEDEPARFYAPSREDAYALADKLADALDQHLPTKVARNY